MATNFHSVAIQVGAGGATVNAPMLQILGTAYNRPKIMEIGVCYVPTNNTTQVFGIGRPTVEGTPSSYNPSLGMFAENPNDVESTIKLVTSWSVVPTIPPDYLRRVTLRSLSAVASTAIITSNEGLGFNASKSLTIFNIASGTSPADIFNFWVVVDQ